MTESKNNSPSKKVNIISNILLESAATPQQVEKTGHHKKLFTELDIKNTFGKDCIVLDYNIASSISDRNNVETNSTTQIAAASCSGNQHSDHDPYYFDPDKECKVCN